MHSICTGAPYNDRSECMRWFIERVVSEGWLIIIIIGVCPLQYRRVVHKKYQSSESAQLIYIGGLSTIKNKYLCFENNVSHTWLRQV